MKRIIIAAALAAAAFLSNQAQAQIFNSPDNKPYFGVRVAGEVTCPGNLNFGDVGVGTFNNGGGIEFGGIYNRPIVANFYIEPGVKFYYNTYSVKKQVLNALPELDPDYPALDNASVRKFGMRIPVMAGYHVDFPDNIKVSVFTGPELEIGFTGKVHSKYHGLNLSEGIYGNGIRRVNVLWCIGAGISYRQFMFSVSGGIGMVDMASARDVKFHENRVSFTLGYNF